MKLYSAAWFSRLGDVLAAALAHWGGEHVVLRLARNVAAQAPDGVHDGMVIAGSPPPDPAPFVENGHTMTADPIAGQKTGYFLDQRSNRALVGDYAADRDVLDVFCCHGGFSAHAAAAGARSVHATDLSPFAVASAEHHVATNAPGIPMQSTVGDAFAVMEDLRTEGRSFDLIVVDPPSFASRRARGRRGHSGLHPLESPGPRPASTGGVLLQASCSSRVDAEMFGSLVTDAIDRAGRRSRLITETGHDDDHPIGFPEGTYLNAVLAELD